jgi:hypothetical protein
MESFEERCVELAHLTGMRAAHAQFSVETATGELVYHVSVSPERLWERVTVHVSPALGAVWCAACGEAPCAHAGSALMRANCAQSSTEVPQSA